jgi:hypothetical protein
MCSLDILNMSSAYTRFLSSLGVTWKYFRGAHSNSSKIRKVGTESCHYALAKEKNSLIRARRSKVRIRRTRVEHDKPISRSQKNIRVVGIGPNGVFYRDKPQADRQNSRSGMGVFSKVRESIGRPIQRWNRAELYFTVSSRYTIEVLHAYKLRGQKAFLGQIWSIKKVITVKRKYVSNVAF